jgi:hypothetical protein
MKKFTDEELEERMTSGAKEIILKILRSGYFTDTEESQMFLASLIMDAVGLGVNCALDGFTQHIQDVTP